MIVSSHDAQPRMETPCVGVCSVDARGVCTGCGRTLEQIAQWTSFTAAARLAIMQELSPAIPPDPFSP